MSIFKFLGSWLLAAAAVALINDVTRGLAPGARFAFLSARGLWQMVHESSFVAAQVAIQKGVHLLVWDPGVLGVLKLPAWFLLAAVGAGLCYLGRRRHRVELYSN